MACAAAVSPQRKFGTSVSAAPRTRKSTARITTINETFRRGLPRHLYLTKPRRLKPKMIYSERRGSAGVVSGGFEHSNLFGLTALATSPRWPRSAAPRSNGAVWLKHSKAAGNRRLCSVARNAKLSSAPLANINAEAIVVVMVVVMMVMVPVRRWDKALIPLMVVVVVVMVVVMVMVVMVVILRNPFPVLRLCCGDAGVIRLQGIQCIRNRFQQVAIASGWRIVRRLGNIGLCGAHCRQRGRCA
jgi:hypothetical protein